MHVAIIIVTWNGKHVLSDCLASLQKAIQRAEEKNHAITTIVVDNASTDGTADFIKQKFPSVVLVHNAQNLGFAGGNNRGIDVAMRRHVDCLWLLNNDTTVEARTLLTLIESIGQKGDILGSKIYFAPGQEYHKERYTNKEQGRVFWYAGGIIDWNNIYASHRGVDAVDTGQYDRKEPTDFVSGCSLFCTANIIHTVGMFDERYYLYLEDVDLCMRAKQKGYTIMYEPRSLVWHKNAATSGKPGSALHQYYQTRNRLLFGMTYASYRTKFALFRESLGQLYQGAQVQKQAVGDFYVQKFGRNSHE